MNRQLSSLANRPTQERTPANDSAVRRSKYPSSALQMSGKEQIRMRLPNLKLMELSELVLSLSCSCEARRYFRSLFFSRVQEWVQSPELAATMFDATFNCICQGHACTDFGTLLDHIIDQHDYGQMAYLICGTDQHSGDIERMQEIYVAHHVPAEIFDRCHLSIEAWIR